MIRAITLGLWAVASSAAADPAEVVEVRATPQGDSWRFDVTLAHPDTGWDHYADGWRVEDAEGNDLGTRILTHPHVNEQPFTRSQGGITVPDGATVVYIRARDNLDGWAEEAVAFTLP